ncbi:MULTISPECIES: YebO family protein [Photorhabdus]|uniref:YebO-like protein n=1 Tax=Photorhabdus temperata subsp. temperata Meg1 TaxID=1393735 RepID=A0A081RXI6_PHOTE|nr:MULTISPECIES: YebO family protein [Photorhabdus]KER03389.1 YebO-like protein [Photorhabdus temperata subsp. temperata Meg1]
MEAGMPYLTIITIVSYVILFAIAWFIVKKASKTEQQIAMLKEIIEKQDSIIAELKHMKRD